MIDYSAKKFCWRTIEACYMYVIVDVNKLGKCVSSNIFYELIVRPTFHIKYNSKFM